ncbi:DUF1697 domain-containing protein [Arthrobacter sp. TMN-49]
MTNYAVFLRGINVGGINVKMAELRTALATLPVSRVKTLLASGNVVCSTNMAAGALKTAVEKLLRDSFGYDAWVVVLERETLQEIIDVCPYPADDSSQHSYVTLSNDPAVLDELATRGSEIPELELARLSPEALAWLAETGSTLASPFSKLTARPRYKSTTTTRNLRTLLKCCEAMG